jgi:hypothetical protein
MVRAILAGQKTMTRRVVPERILEKQLVIDVPVSIHAKHYAPIRVGDVLWVRETWRRIGFLLPVYEYKADYQHTSVAHWRPSIFMPKEVARIFLKVTGVRVERLQEITVKDIMAEGITTSNRLPDDCIKSFGLLWDNLNKKRGFGWGENPYVFVYEFERT